MEDRRLDEPSFHRTIKIQGASPSDLKKWLEAGWTQDKLRFEIIPAPTVFELLLTSKELVSLDAALASIEREWGRFCYATEGKKLEERIGEYLLSRGQRLAVAESCTGGRIASRLTSIPGSSRYFESACVSYSDRSKQRLLSVPAPLIREKGAVSREVASAMSEGIRMGAGVDLGLAVTGIAGPSGASQEKPVGLVYISLSDPHQTHTMEYQFQGNRETIQSAAAQTALEGLRQYLVS